MIQNIRVDTIYYSTNSDFEMEFNLCGCCKMRLLTDKTDHPKEFINQLAKAVARSQVIICCGKLFDKDGLINLVSRAIKKGLTVINNSSYDIADSSEISIIEGSVPLVNSDGCFCGCIIESGPQSIILLTDNKSIRKTVMKSLIHPYIEELSVLPHNSTDTENEDTINESEIVIEQETEEASENTEVESVEEIDEASEESVKENSEDTDSLEVEATEENKTPESDNEEASTTEDIQETADIETKDEATKPDDSVAMTDFIFDSEDENSEDNFMDVDPAEINSGFGLYLEPERVKFSKKSHYALDYSPSEQDNAFISGDEDSDISFSSKKDKNMLNIPILIISIILLVALAVLAYILLYLPTATNHTFSEFVRHIFSVAVKTNTFNGGF